ncbi:MAG TPA: hypothetical protein VKB86_20265 [Pyrinomonadaceae bacterium]|nr:hypothetical protein [Pyrinomonadaceae bacterium]
MAELFADFEVNKEPRWRRVLRLTIVSFVLHALFFAAILYVPILREMFHLADKASGIKFVDEDYEKTQIHDRAVLVDVSHKLQYPPGYFDKNPTGSAELVEQPTPAPTPQIVFRARPTPRPTPLPTPKPSPSAKPSPSPADATSEIAANPPKTKEEADKAIDDIAAKTGVVRPMEDKINKKPLKDWLAHNNEKYKSGKLDLSKTIELVIVAKRDDKGKLSDPQVVSKAGDPNLADAAREFVEAINDSNILYFLEGVGGSYVRFVVKLDDANVTASVESEVESEARAKDMANAYAVMLFAGKISKSDKDEGVIYQNTHITSKGKQVIVNFTLPRQAASEMLKKQLPTS